MEMKRDSYPANGEIVGRRAREVMPAAMRALGRTGKLAQLPFIDRFRKDRGPDQQRS